MQIVPLKFLSYISVVFKIRHDPFSAGALPRTRWGRSRRSPDPLVGCRGETPHHSAPTHYRRSPCVRLRIPARSTPMSFYQEVGDVANKSARKLRGWSQWNLALTARADDGLVPASACVRKYTVRVC